MPVELGGFKANFHEKPVSEGLDEVVVLQFLKGIYKDSEPIQLHRDSSPQEIKDFRGQAKALYKKGVELGLVNLIDLKGKFDAVKDGDVQQDGFHNIGEIKKTMERIIFQVAADSEKGKQLDPKFNDYPFLCGEGTLTNMQSILQQLVLNSATVDDMLTLTKKQMIEQYTTEFYTKNIDFLEKLEGMHSEAIYEVHNISSLLNKVADDYGLIKKTKQDDQYLQDYINEDVQALLKSSIERQLNSEHSGEILIDLTADRIMSDLPKFKVGNDKKLIESLDEFFQNLGVADKLNTYSLLDFDEDTYQIKGYKENALEVIKDTLAIHLHDKGTVLNPDIDFLRAKVEYFDSQLSEVQGHEILEYVKNKGLEEKILLYALDKDYEIDGKDPIKWAIDNNLNINGKSAIEWAIEKDLKVDGKSAFSYAVEDLGKNQGKLLEHVINNDLKVDGKSAFSYAVEDLGKNQGKLLKYAIDNDLIIDDKPAFLYAVEDLGKNKDELLKYAVDNDIKIGGESAIKLAVKSDEKINGKPAFLYAVEDLGKNEEKILKYAIKNDINIAGKPALEWAVLNDKTIAGESPVAYAHSINVKVAGMDLMDWVDKNVDRLLSKKAPKEMVVGRHTEKVYKDSNLAASQSVKVR